MPEIVAEKNITDWAAGVHTLFKAHQVDMISFVPDAGHRDLIELCERDTDMHTITLTTEEEGVALAAGAFLGGKRSALLLQSSGVGNCVNMLALPSVCNMPLFILVTMRGEWGEFNPWQVPMGQGTQAVLEACGVIVFRAETSAAVAPTVEAALQLAFQSRQRVAVLLAQKLLGAKPFTAGQQ